jgi:hypothetical protein
MQSSVGAVLLSGGIFLSASAAVADPPSVAAEEALATEQTSLRSVLHPTCAGNGDEIVVCGRRPPHSERLPLAENRVHSLPGEGRPAVDIMRSIDTPRPQRIGATAPTTKDPPMLDFLKAAGVLLAVGERLVGAEHVPPIPSDRSPD